MLFSVGHVLRAGFLLVWLVQLIDPGFYPGQCAAGAGGHKKRDGKNGQKGGCG